jgi:hypothetical protein
MVLKYLNITRAPTSTIASLRQFLAIAQPLLQAHQTIWDHEQGTRGFIETTHSGRAAALKIITRSLQEDTLYITDIDRRTLWRNRHGDKSVSDPDSVIFSRPEYDDGSDSEEDYDHLQSIPNHTDINTNTSPPSSTNSDTSSPRCPSEQ